MAYLRYTPEMVEWLREWYPQLDNEAVMDRFESEFGTRPSPSGLATKCSKLGIRKPRKEWTADEVAWFVGYVPGHSESEISAEHERLFGEPLTESQIGNAKHRHGVKSGTHGGRFSKGQKAWNKGKKQTEFMSLEAIERTKATRFRKGQVHDRRDGWLKPVGYERVDREGYTWVKVRDSRSDGIQRNEPGHHNENYRLKHHVVWERLNGPIPPSTMIVFADRDKSNFDHGNLVAVPRRLWCRISQMHMEYHDRESLEACVMRARLHAAMSEKRKALR